MVPPSRAVPVHDPGDRPSFDLDNPGHQVRNTDPVTPLRRGAEMSELFSLS